MKGVADRGERVPEVVGDAGGELTDGGELLDARRRLAGAEELGLHAVPLGDVAADDHDRRLAGEGDAEGRGLDGDLRAVLLDEALLARARAGPGRGDAEAQLGLGAIGREDEITVAPADELARVGVLERLEERAVRVDEAIVADDGDAIGRAFDQRAEAPLRLGERVLGPALLDRSRRRAGEECDDPPASERARRAREAHQDRARRDGLGHHAGLVLEQALPERGAHRGQDDLPAGEAQGAEEDQEHVDTRGEAGDAGHRVRRREGRELDEEDRRHVDEGDAERGRARDAIVAPAGGPEDEAHRPVDREEAEVALPGAHSEGAAEAEVEREEGADAAEADRVQAPHARQSLARERVEGGRIERDVRGRHGGAA